jgi:hypothetical protein
MADRPPGSSAPSTLRAIPESAGAELAAGAVTPVGGALGPDTTPPSAAAGRPPHQLLSADGPPAIDGERILAAARELAFPRYPGTAGDRRAIEWVAGRFAATGLEVAVEPFSYDLRPAWRALRGMLGWGAAMLAAAGLLAPRAPGWATAALAAALVPGLAFLGWAPGLERLYRRPGATETATDEARPPAPGRRPRPLS